MLSKERKMRRTGGGALWLELAEEEHHRMCYEDGRSSLTMANTHQTYRNLPKFWLPNEETRSTETRGRDTTRGEAILA